MREFCREFVRLCVEEAGLCGPVYEFGALEVNAPNTRDLFSGQEFIGADLVPGKGVDRVLDLRSLDLSDACAETVVCLDTLEHVEFCRQAIAEMHRVLRPGGYLALVTVFAFPLHHTPDLWRFSVEGLASLLRSFPFPIIVQAGQTFSPHTVAALARKGAPMPGHAEARLRHRLRSWSRSHRRA